MNLDFAALQENIDDCDARIAASGAVLGMLDDKLARAGCLPTAGEMQPAVRSVVQAMAVDLIRLPVREMSEPYAEFQRIEDAHPTRIPLAPAGLTRLATDGERNGRLSWLPGAQA